MAENRIMSSKEERNAADKRQHKQDQIPGIFSVEVNLESLLDWPMAMQFHIQNENIVFTAKCAKGQYPAESKVYVMIKFTLEQICIRTTKREWRTNPLCVSTIAVALLITEIVFWTYNVFWIWLFLICHLFGHLGRGENGCSNSWQQHSICCSRHFQFISQGNVSRFRNCQVPCLSKNQNNMYSIIDDAFKP